MKLYNIREPLCKDATILRSTEEAVQGGYYGPGLQLPTEREA